MIESKIKTHFISDWFRMETSKSFIIKLGNNLL